MDKTEAQSVLMQVQVGTFLVRFSDSEAGAASVTWVAGMFLYINVDFQHLLDVVLLYIENFSRAIKWA